MRHKTQLLCCFTATNDALTSMLLHQWRCFTTRTCYFLTPDQLDCQSPIAILSYHCGQSAVCNHPGPFHHPQSFEVRGKNRQELGATTPLRLLIEQALGGLGVRLSTLPTMLLAHLHLSPSNATRPGHSPRRWRKCGSGSPAKCQRLAT